MLKSPFKKIEILIKINVEANEGSFFGNKGLCTLLPEFYYREQLKYSNKLVEKAFCSSQKNEEPIFNFACNTFEDLVVGKNNIFVDKTLLIEEFLSDSKSVILLTFPRRWGKTINLSMIQTFLEIEVDDQGNKKNEPKKEKLFANTKITKIYDKMLTLRQYLTLDEEATHAEEMTIEEFQGNFPVISISFKDIKGSNYDEIKEKVIKAIKKVFREHMYLLNSKALEKLDEEHRLNHMEVLNKYIDRLSPLDEVEIEDSLLFLSEMLSLHFENKRVFILIDEYDTPINSIISEENFEKGKKFQEYELEKVLGLFRGIFSASLKGNKYLEKALITGIIRIAKEELFSGANNFFDYQFLNSIYSKYYGFNENDIAYLFKEFKTPDSLAEEIKEWYNGYEAGELQLYNPWSIICCFASNYQLRNYWTQSGNVKSFLGKIIENEESKAEIQNLIDGNLIEFNLEHRLTIDEINNLYNSDIIKNCYQQDDLFSFLFAAGYISHDKESGNYRLPNHEIRNEMKKILLSYYQSIYQRSIEPFKLVLQALHQILNKKGHDYQEEKTQLMLHFKELLSTFPEFIKERGAKGLHGNEDIFHSILTYICLEIGDCSTLGSEVPCGRGNRGGTGIADIVISNTFKGVGIIIELKYNKTAGVALKQIKENEYFDYFSKKEIKKVVLIGLNVDRDKNVEVEIESDELSRLI